MTWTMARRACQVVPEQHPLEALPYGASAVAVESPTDPGALQAFASCGPEYAALERDDKGPLPASLAAQRGALAEAAQAAGLPVVDDNS